MQVTLTVVSMAPALTAGADNALQPWASKAQPGDVAKSHVEEISQAEHDYTVVHGGTIDGECCRTPMGCGINREGVIEQSWQSNRAVRMENVGQTDLVNPWLSNGRNNFRNLDEIVASAVTPGMSDKEKAMALWFQQVSRRFHRGGYGGDLGDPVLVFNVYGHNVCGQDAQIMGAYWQKVGLKSAPVRLVSHAIAQVQYDGGWHVMDGDLDSFFLLRDNETVASDRELARDHDLIKRTHTYGITLADTRRIDEAYAAMFVCEDPVRGDRAGQPKSTMNMTLRPGEALVWRWGHLTPAKYSWRRGAARLPRHRLQRPLGIPAGLHAATSGRKARPRSRTSSAARTGFEPKKARRARSSGRCGAPTSSSAGDSRWKATGPCWRSPRTARSG